MHARSTVTARQGVYATLDVVDGAETTWSWVDLKRPAVALTVVVAFALSAPAATIVSCNAHEVGHAVTGTLFGWKVDHISLCAPTGGEVHYRTSSSRGDAFESWAGGLTGALVLLLAHLLAIGPNARPLRSPVIWAIGLGVALPIGPQLAVAILEGTNRETSYSDTISENSAIWVPTILISAALGPACHLWRWRAVLRLSR